MYLNRTLCDVLQEMRDLLEALNKETVKQHKLIMPHLISEAQHFGNKMEAGLGENKDIRYLHEQRSKLNKEVEALRKERDELKEELEKEPTEDDDLFRLLGD